MSDAELKTLIIDRFYEMRKRKTRSTSKVIGAIEKARISVISVFTNEAMFAHFIPMEMLLKMRDMIIEAAKHFESPSFAQEDATLKDYFAVLEKHIKTITPLRKSNIDVLRLLLSTQTIPEVARYGYMRNYHFSRWSQ